MWPHHGDSRPSYGNTGKHPCYGLMCLFLDNGSQTLFRLVMCISFKAGACYAYGPLWGPVWQGFGSSKNSSGSGSSDGAASLVELEPF